MPDTAQPQARAPEASHHPVNCAGTACPCYQEGLGNQVHQVPPGSVVVLRGDHNPDHLGILAGELANAAGHHQFVLVDLPAGTSLDVVHDPQAVADLLGLARPELATPAPPCPRCGYCCVAQAVRTCRVCGCTDARACPGGCSWADLCTACLPESRLADLLAAELRDQFEGRARDWGPHPALLIGDSTACPCGEPTTAPLHHGQLHMPTGLVPPADLMQRLEASLAATRAYLAAHPPEAEAEPVTNEDRRLGYRQADEAFPGTTETDGT